MRPFSLIVVIALLAASAPSRAGCSPDSVKVGAACVDRYEASVWSIPVVNTSLIRKVQRGRATLADLSGGGAVLLGVGLTADYPCPVNGNGCKGQIYAVSIPGVLPSARISWFQAQQACGNSDKRLLTNAEWQMAAAGTPDPGFADNGSTDCNVFSAGTPVNAGSRSACVSDWRVFDMVGNRYEWVAEWFPAPSACSLGWGAFSDDDNCLSSTPGAGGPIALDRGGNYGYNTLAGVFTVDGEQPYLEGPGIGLRCAR